MQQKIMSRWRSGLLLQSALYGRDKNKAAWPHCQMPHAVETCLWPKVSLKRAGGSYRVRGWISETKQDQSANLQHPQIQFQRFVVPSTLYTMLKVKYAVSELLVSHSRVTKKFQTTFANNSHTRTLCTINFYRNDCRCTGPIVFIWNAWNL